VHSLISRAKYVNHYLNKALQFSRVYIQCSKVPCSQKFLCKQTLQWNKPYFSYILDWQDNPVHHMLDGKKVSASLHCIRSFHVHSAHTEHNNNAFIDIQWVSGAARKSTVMWWFPLFNIKCCLSQHLTGDKRGNHLTLENEKLSKTVQVVHIVSEWVVPKICEKNIHRSLSFSSAQEYTRTAVYSVGFTDIKCPEFCAHSRIH